MSSEAAPRAHRPESSTAAGLVWLGHSTVLIELDGVRVLTDPVLRDRVGPLVRISASIQPTDVGVLDGVLLSHLHADHADVPTLQALAYGRPILAPASSRAWLAARGFHDVREVSPGEETGIGSVTVRAVPAVHDGRRWPFGPAPSPIGYLVLGSSSVYFAGDTDLFPGMAELRGRVDVALLPVWGWGRRVGPGHLDPQRAAAAAALIRPRVAIPIHWGTFALPRAVRTAGDPARPALDFASRVRRDEPGVEVRVLRPGEGISL